MKKQSFLLYGPPGSGKSHLRKRVLQSLDDAVVCARTHVACTQFDTAVTLSRLKHRIQKGYFKGSLVLDEAFMCEMGSWTSSHALR